MLLSKALVSSLLIASSAVDATRAGFQISCDQGKSTLSFEGMINLDSINRQTITSMDRKRISAMVGKHRDTSISAVNALFYYAISIRFGTPPTNYTLSIDTGSSVTWIGANISKPYIRTDTSIDTGKNFSVHYGSGSQASGEAYLDTLTLSTDLVVKKQLIGVANRTIGNDFQGVDGFFGAGPTDLTENLVNNITEFPTVTDTLYTQRMIPENVLGIYFGPASAPSSTGELTFGGYDESVILDTIEYAPLTKTYPASRYWGVDISVSYGEETILSNAAGIVDTGTTLILLETEAFQKYQNATGAVMDESTGLLSITATQYANLKPLTFRIGRKCYDLTPNGQIWPRSLNVAIGGNESAIYLVVSELLPVPELPVSSILGMSFLERFYSVYDTQHKRVGFAKTAYTDANIN